MKQKYKHPTLINLDNFEDNRGNLGVVEREHIPFDIKRVYYLYKVPQNQQRGVHAHKKLQQLMICLNGSVKVKIKSQTNNFVYELNDPSKGLYMPPMHWREINEFRDNAILLVLASLPYDETDYIYFYDEFVNM